MTCLTRLLWSSSSYPTNCYDCVFTIGIHSLDFWRNFLLHVWQRLFHLLPCFFSGKSVGLSEGLWQGVVDVFPIIPFQKYYPLVVEAQPLLFIFYHKSQINGYCLLLWNIRLLLGGKLMKFQRSELEMFCLSTPSKFFYNSKDKALALRCWQWHHQCMYLFLKSAFRLRCADWSLASKMCLSMLRPRNHNTIFANMLNVVSEKTSLVCLPFFLAV